MTPHAGFTSAARGSLQRTVFLRGKTVLGSKAGFLLSRRQVADKAVILGELRGKLNEIGNIFQ
jgi:hypothetical protein